MLRLGHPALLWLLLLLPLLWWLARPVRPPRVVDSPHLLRWQRARARLGRRTPRLRGPRFLLAVLAALCLIGAACEPFAFGKAGRTRLVLGVDLSPSMGARDGSAGRTRLSEAVARLARLLREVPPWIPVRVLGFDGGGARVLRPETEPREGLLAFLEGLAPRAGHADLAVVAAADWGPGDQLIVGTDGAGATSLPEPWPTGQGPGLLVECVGSARANLGVAGLRTRDHWPLPEIDLEIVLVNASETTRRVSVFGGREGEEALLTEVELPEHSLTPVAARLSRGEGGQFRVRVAGDDVFPQDDAVTFLVPPPARPKIALVAAPGPGLQTLQAMVEALAAETQGAVLAQADAAGADLVLVDGGELPSAPARGRAWLCFGTRIPGLVAAGAHPLPAPVLTDWDRTHRLLEGIDLSALRVRAALPFQTGDGLPLLLGDRGPLAVLREDPRAILFGFTLADSTLATMPEFPRLLRRALAFLLRADTAIAPRIEGLLDLQESRIAPAPAPPAAPIVWHRPELGLGPYLGLLALLFWTARAWLAP